MATTLPNATTHEAARLPADFWRFWAGQTISNLGNSVSLLAFPLIVFKLTGSALNLGLTTAISTLPYLFFGLIIGAWVDQAQRKRVMIATDLLRGALVATIPVLAWLGELRVWWVYAIGFATATLTICFDSCEFAAIPSLVSGDGQPPSNAALLQANGRVQASYSAATVIGPLLAGALLALLSVESIVLVDALSFLVSAVSLSLVRRSFNVAPGSNARRHLRSDMAEGLRFVMRHPVLRSISLMMALANCVSVTIYAQLVLYANDQLGVGASKLGLLYASGSVGVIFFSLLAAKLRKRWSLSQVLLGSLLLDGVMMALLAFTTSLWVAMALLAASNGFGMLFNINTGSLRQTIVPNQMLGRVMSIAAVMATCASPIGSLAGGVAVQRTGSVAEVYGVVGLLIMVIAVSFAFTALGHADRYLPADQPAQP